MTAPVQPQPAPMAWAFGEATAETGQKFIVIVIHTVHGPLQFFFPAEDAKTFVEQMSAQVKQSTTGIILAKGMPMPPLPPMNGHN